MAFSNDTLSPDPLALSLDGPIDRKPDIKSSPRPITPTPSSRPGHGNVQLQDFYLTTPQAALLRTSSPSRSMAQTENLLSPWRIRVRVEAERSDATSIRKQSSPSPTRRVGQWTKTTTVPLKGAGDSALPSGKRPRGRPRKSIDGSVKRKGTPKPRKFTKKKMLDEEADDVQGLAADLATPSKGSKFRTKQASELDENEEFRDNHDSEYEPATKKRNLPKGSKYVSTSTTTSKPRAMRKATSPVQNLDNVEEEPTTSVVETRMSRQSSDRTSPKVSSQTRKVQTKAITMSPTSTLKRKRGKGEEDLLPKQPVGASAGQSSVNQEVVGDCLKAQREHLSGENEKMDPSNEHREFDSIVESEGFSMVSVSTLPSAKQNFIVSPIEKVHGSLKSPNLEARVSEGLATLESTGKRMSRATLHPPTLAPTEATKPSPNRGRQEGGMSGDDTLNAMPSAARTGHVRRLRSENSTPAKDDILPSMPPLPDPDPFRTSKASSRSCNLPSGGNTTVTRTHIVENALQDVLQPLQARALEPVDTTHDARVRSLNGFDFRLERYGSGTRRQLRESLRLGEELEVKSLNYANLDNQISGTDLFSNGLSSKLNGFGAGTRRELKAGLRLGKELAARQRVSTNGLSNQPYTMDAEFPDLSTFKEAKLLTPSESDVASQSHKHGEVAYPEMSTTHRQNASEVRYPNLPLDQLLSPERSNDRSESELENSIGSHRIDFDNEDRMGWNASTLKSTERLAAEDLSLPLLPPRAKSPIDWMARREVEWQREREAISRQIQQANESQVIVIDSSTIADRNRLAEDNERNESDQEVEKEVSEDGDLDVWQSEANNSKNASRRPQHNTSVDALEVLFPEAQVIPRRSKLPLAWRRQSMSNIVYSDEHTSTDPDPFFPSPEKKEPETPLQLHGRRSSRDNATDFSNFSDFGRPVDECATVQFKRPRLVQSVEDKIAYVLEEGTPDDGNDVETAQRNSSDIMDLDPASQLHGSSPSNFRRQHVNTAIAGAKDRSTVGAVVGAASGSQWARDPVSRPFEPRAQASHRSQTSSRNPVEVFTHASAQPSTHSSGLREGQPSGRLAKPISSTDFRAQSVRRSTQSQSQPPNRSSIQSQTKSCAPLPSQPPQALHSRLFTSVKPLLSSFLPTNHSFAATSATPRTEVSSSSPPLQFTIHHPWTNAHYLVLQPLYLEAQAQKHIQSYDPDTSPSSFLLGKTVRSQGWSKTIEAWELGVVDAFIAVLLEQGVKLESKKPGTSGWWNGFKEMIDAFVGSKGIRSWEQLSRADAIDEVEVVKRVFSLWVGRVQRGEEKLGDGVAGTFDQRYRDMEGIVKGWV